MELLPTPWGLGGAYAHFHVRVAIRCDTAPTRESAPGHHSEDHRVVSMTHSQVKGAEGDRLSSLLARSRLDRAGMLGAPSAEHPERGRACQPHTPKTMCSSAGPPGCSGSSRTRRS